ncbi:MAG: radical SAM protein [Treponema sp.]
MIRDFCCTEYEHCTACPKACGVNRNTGSAGFCGETAELRIAWAGLHFGEEPPVTGRGGSGTIFITGCNLRCIFCQNFQISQRGMGRAVTEVEFVRICLTLQSAGAENINIVTGSHAIPALAKGLRAAKEHGLCIPVVWNSSAYETETALQSLKGAVDGWLPDLKTLSSSTAQVVFYAPDYPDYARRALAAMADTSPLVITEVKEDYPFGKMLSGVIVRHLALPGKLEDTKAVLQWFAEHLKGKALLSLMTQYTPVSANGTTKGITAFSNRLLDESEDIRLRQFLETFGIDDGFYQELVSDTGWLPDFARVQTFSSALSKPLWHWRERFIS